MNFSLASSPGVSISKSELGCAIFCLVGFLIGILARFDALGNWCLAVDEFYIAKSVELIQQKGIPLYPSGGLYWRGLLFQYFEAASTGLFGLNEYALRLPAVLFNLLTIPPLFLLGRKRIGNVGAFLLVSFFCVSIWEVEFARFARMYSMFQCAFLWFLYYFHEGFFLGRKRAILWSYAIASISTLIHEGAIFMACLLFLPLLFRGVSLVNQLWYGIWASAIMLLNVVSPKMWSWLFPGSSGNPYPQGFALPQEGGGPLLLPDLSLWESVLLRGDFWGVGYMVLVLMGISLAYMGMKNSLWDWRQKTLALALLGAGLMQLFGVMVGILLVSYFTQILDPRMVFRKSLERGFAIFLVSCLGFWLTVGLFITTGHMVIEGGESLSLHKIFAIVFHYPRVMEEFGFLWFNVMPYLMTLSCLFGFLVLWGRRNSQQFVTEHFLLLVLVSCILILGVINTMYNSTRYSFFLYPLILLLWFEGALAGKSWLDHTLSPNAILGKVPKFAVVLLAFGLLLCSEDFSFAHIMNIGKAEVNFRMNVSEEVSVHYYQRSDVRGPADYINEAWKPGDLIVNAVPSSSFYLTHENYIFYDDQSSLFRENSQAQGTKDRWGNLILHNKDTVQKAVQGRKGAVWILATPRYQMMLTEWVQEALGNNVSGIYSTNPGRDKRIQVITVVRNPP
ncbi:ArnT family glycosyltransferase [Nitrospira sp. T9]|uniref:ArnT family glycosyltransferase n=1 Tax=unclassified Nitrospira TaxID=2652172 RepID=UPI003F9C63F3